MAGSICRFTRIYLPAGDTDRAVSDALWRRIGPIVGRSHQDGAGVGDAVATDGYTVVQNVLARETFVGQVVSDHPESVVTLPAIVVDVGSAGQTHLVVTDDGGER